MSAPTSNTDQSRGRADRAPRSHTAATADDGKAGNAGGLQQHELDHLQLINMLAFLGGATSFDGPADIIYELTPNCEWCGELFCVCAERDSWVQGEF